MQELLERFDRLYGTEATDARGSLDDAGALREIFLAYGSDPFRSWQTEHDWSGYGFPASLVQIAGTEVGALALVEDTNTQDPRSWNPTVQSIESTHQTTP